MAYSGTLEKFKGTKSYQVKIENCNFDIKDENIGRYIFMWEWLFNFLGILIAITSFCWRLLIHGSTDSYSRPVIYLHCCNNNKAETAKAQFLRNGLTVFWPRRVRSDHGVENIEVAREILKKIRNSSKLFLTGLSVHNHRIERLWKHVLH